MKHLTSLFTLALVAFTFTTIGQGDTDLIELKGQLIPMTGNWTSVVQSPEKDTNSPTDVEFRVRINSDSDAKAIAVADGSVSAVVNTPKALAVIVRHGEFLVTYSQLESVSVKMGESVQKGKPLGIPTRTVAHSFMDFEVWQGSNRTIAKEWLALE